METKNSNAKIFEKKTAVKEIRYHFSWFNKILLYLTLPVWILPTLIINLILGKMFRNNLQHFPKKGPVDYPGYENVYYDTLEFYNRDMEIKNAPKELIISEQEWFKMNVKEALIPTFDQTTLEAFLIISAKPTNKWIVVLHGWMQNRYSILYLAKPFYDAGFNVLVYNARNHGSNQDSTTTFGLNEAKDLFFVIKYLKEKYQKDNIEIALIGNSMGASTILQALVDYDLSAMNVKSAIFDCGYDDFSHMIKILGITRIDHHWFWFYYGLKFWLKYQDKFNISDIVPIKKMQNCSKTPILFIHGTKDQTVPITMTKKLFQEKIKYEKTVRNKKPSELLIIEGARHVEAMTTNYPLYTKTAFKFVNKWFSKKNKKEDD